MVTCLKRNLLSSSLDIDKRDALLLSFIIEPALFCLEKRQLTLTGLRKFLQGLGSEFKIQICGMDTCKSGLRPYKIIYYPQTRLSSQIWFNRHDESFFGSYDLSLGQVDFL
jgi:hypothetical protein